MSRFVTEADVKVIHAEWWDEAETVTVRRYNIAQRDRMHGEILHVTGAVGQLTEVEVKAAQIPVLLAGIAEWTFERPNGKVAPVNQQWIGQLPADDADFIAKEIQEFNKARSPEEQEKF